MDKIELLKKLEQIKSDVYERRVMNSIRTLTLLINNLKLEISEEQNKNGL